MSEPLDPLSASSRMLAVPTKGEMRRAQLVGGAIWLVAYGGPWLAWHPDLGARTPTEMLSLAIVLCAIPGVLIQAMVIALARMLDTPAADNPLLGQESLRYKINSRVLGNTVEQTLIFVPLLLAIAVRIDVDHTRVVPILMATWTLGRVLFWAGYHVGAPWRFLGFSASTATNLTAIYWLVRSFLV